MHAEYPKKLPRTYWDPVHVDYPVRKYPDTGVSSENFARKWRREPEIVKDLKQPLDQIKEYFRDYNITKELTKSQTTIDYGFKLPETKRFNKHTSSTENRYIYPPSRKLEERPPQSQVHGNTETKTAFTTPTTAARLVTDKNQYKHSASLSWNAPIEPSWHKELERFDTTHDGFEKYLDPYLTTNRLHHRPFTADQITKLSCSNETVTYYTFSDISWVRKQKPSAGEWRLPLSRPKSMYDREKFKQDFREIATHNKLQWVPGCFRTETRDKYRKTKQLESQIQNDEKDVRSYYERKLANLSTNIPEDSTANNNYNTENSYYGSKKPLCSDVDQFVERNERLKKKFSA